MPRFLPTDLLFLATVLVLLGLVIRSFLDARLQRAYQKLLKRPSALVSMVVLSLYLVIAVADSIRFEVNGATLSLFDLGLTKCRTAVERSYSAPLAVHSLSSQWGPLEGGGEVFGPSRLRYGGRHLDDDLSGWGRDLRQRSLAGGALGLGIGAILSAPWLVAALRKKPGGRVNALRQIAQGHWGWPLRSLILTILVLGGLIGLTVEVAEGYHVLGTDKVGADVLYQGLKGIRTGLLIGLLTTVTTLPLSVVLGVLAGYYRGWVDDLIQFLYTALNAMPGVLLIAASMLVMDTALARHPEAFGSLQARADVRLLALCLILGMTSWTGLCRLIRAETLKLSALEFVDAARVLGVSGPRILLRHLLPNLSHLVLISVALDFSGLVLAEAVLSYVNIGVDPTTESWGNMINTARLELAREPLVWWSLAASFFFMFVLVLAANLLADALRDAFDPRFE